MILYTLSTMFVKSFFKKNYNPDVAFTHFVYKADFIGLTKLKIYGKIKYIKLKRRTTK